MTRIRIATITLTIALATLSAHAQQPGKGRKFLQHLVQFANAYQQAASGQSTYPGPPAYTGPSAYGVTTDGLIGTWIGGSGNGGDYASYQITLSLRDDGTYTKTLSAGGYGGMKGFGGTHQGTWTCSGTIVYLSGDGNWPASTVNLAAFRRVN